LVSVKRVYFTTLFSVGINVENKTYISSISCKEIPRITIPNKLRDTVDRNKFYCNIFTWSIIKTLFILFTI